MKKRVSIYIEEEAWENLKERAWKSRKSASAYLEGLIRRSEEEKESVIPKMSIEDLAAKQAELDAKKAKRNIKKEAIERVKFGYSKDRQLGKRGAK